MRALKKLEKQALALKHAEISACMRNSATQTDLCLNLNNTKLKLVLASYFFGCLVGTLSSLRSSAHALVFSLEAVRCEFVVNHFQVRIKKVQLGVAATHLDVHDFFCTAGRADRVAQQVFSEWSRCTRTQILLSRPDSLTC